jgi:L-malate glycosyltransferase
VTVPPRLVHVFPSFGAGGAELRIARIINYLGGRMRHVVIALNGRFEARYAIDSGLAEFHAPELRRDPLRSMIDLRRTVLGLSPDLLLTYNWGSMDAILGMLPGNRCPIIHNECGFSDVAELQKLRRVWTRRIALNRIRQTLVTSRTMLAIAREQFRIDDARLRFIQTGVDTTRFHPEPNLQLRDELGVARDEVLFGCVGGLRREKGQALLLEAFAAAGLDRAGARARLALFGSGKERLRLEEHARTLGIGDRVIFAGHHEDSSACFRAMDVFAMSSLTEQTPNALLEAMASGLPAICTDVGDTSYLLGEEQSGFVLPTRDAAAYGARMREMATDAALRKHLGEQNRRRAVEMFPVQRMLDEYAQCYEDAI